VEITLDKHSANQASVKITLNEADYQPNVDSKIKDYAKKANIRGFRPGKAPITMVKKLYGTSVIVEEINNILSSSLNNFLKEQTFKILGDPLPVIEDADKIDWSNQKDFEFSYKIGFVDGIDIKLDKKIKSTSYQIEVDEKTVSDSIQNISRQYGKMTNPEVSEANDFLYGDLKSLEGDFEKTLSLPLSKLKASAAKKFIGVKKDEVIEFVPTKDFKEDLAQTVGVDESELGKLDGKFSFTVKNINRTEDAELNQEFFDKVLGPNQVDSEESFKAKVKEILTDSYNKELTTYNEEQLKNLLVEKAKVDLPEEFLKEWLLRTNEGKITTEDIEKEFPIYAKQLVWSLISNEIAKNNEIKAEHAEVVEKTKEMIRQQFASSGLGSQMEDSMDMFVDNYLKGNEGQNYMQMITSVQNQKVLGFVRENITLNEEVVSVEKFNKLLEN